VGGLRAAHHGSRDLDARIAVDEELHAVPGRRRGVADGDRVNVAGDVSRRIQRPLERFLEELLDAGRCE
jgi:hypothetical protein